jgi:hypothetical protein
MGAKRRTGTNPPIARSHPIPAARDAAAFLLAGAATLAYALPGGAYDIVVRHQLAVGLCWTLLIGVLVGVVVTRGADWRTWAVLAAGAALTAWTAMGFGWTSSDERTLTELARAGHYVVIVAAFALCLDRRSWRAAAGGLGAAAVLVSLLALAGRLGLGWIPASAVDDVFPANRQRIKYPFDYWNTTGAWAGMALALALAWSVSARSLVVRALSLAAAPAVAVVVYLAYSRGALGGALLGAIALLILGPRRLSLAAHIGAAGIAAGGVILTIRDQPQIADATGFSGAGRVMTMLAVAVIACAVTAAVTSARGTRVWRPSRRARRGGMSVLAGASVAVTIAAALLAPGPLSRAWQDFKTTPSTPGGDPAARLSSLGGTRYDIWRVALDAYQRDPLRGTGPGTYEFEWNRFGSDHGFIRDAHSLYVEALSETGAVGLVLVVAFLGGLLLAALLSRRLLDDVDDRGALAGLVAAFSVMLLAAGVDWIWESTGLMALALAAAGTAIAAGRRAVDSAASRGREIVRRAGLALAVLVVALTQLPGLASTSAVRDSQEHVDAGDAPAALARAQEAVEVQPWAAGSYVQRALVQEATGSLENALADARRAAELEPLDWRHPLLIARLEAELGRPDNALAAFRRARSLRPRSLVLSPP